MTPITVILFALFLTFHICTSEPYIQFGKVGSSNGDCFKDFPSLKERFNWEQLQFFCQQWISYTEAVNRNFTIISTFTENQLNYIHSLKVNLSATANSNPMTVRKEYRTMNNAERAIFHFVIRLLKQQTIDGISKYDLLVTLSHPALSPGAHVGAAFLPWHREYVRMFERAMQKINALAVLPFWDTTLDHDLPNAADSILWEADFLGNGDGPVTSGPFAGWFIHPIDKHTSKDGDNSTIMINQELLVPLSRNISSSGRLMSSEDADYIISRSEFRQFSACLDLRLEQMSRYVHEWVGGTMHDVYYAANDPVFFMFHAYIDYLWEIWRRNASYEQRVRGYPANHEACTKLHYANSTMSPFEPLLNADGLSDSYTRLYYTYQMIPKCSTSNPVCRSNLLFCHHFSARCLSKIRLAGNCTGLEEFDSCYQSICINGKCTLTQTNTPPDIKFMNDASQRNTNGLPRKIDILPKAVAKVNGQKPRVP